MKNLVFLFVVCALCSVGAVGQVGGGTMNSQAQALVMSGNPQHASQTAMSAEHLFKAQCLSLDVKTSRITGRFQCATA